MSTTDETQEAGSDTEEPDLPDHLQEASGDGDAWRDLSEEERSQVLDEVEAELGAPGSREEDVSDQDALDAIDQINNKMQEPQWSCTVLDDVEIQMRVPSEEQMDNLSEMGRVFSQVQDAEDVDDLDEDTLSQMDDIDEEVNRLLGGDPDDPGDNGLVAEDGMDYAWFSDGDNYPAEMRVTLIYKIMTRYQSRVSQVTSFRSEQ